jgi:hypothetical protein
MRVQVGAMTSVIPFGFARVVWQLFVISGSRDASVFALSAQHRREYQLQVVQTTQCLQMWDGAGALCQGPAADRTDQLWALRSYIYLVHILPLHLLCTCVNFIEQH